MESDGTAEAMNEGPIKRTLNKMGTHWFWIIEFQKRNERTQLRKIRRLIKSRYNIKNLLQP